MTLAPRHNPVLFGHSEAQGSFASALASGRMHHAWLLTGPPGIGKATLAFRLARRLLVLDGDPDDFSNPAINRLAQGSHADVLTLERAYDPKTKKFKREVAVDQVRDVGGFMHLTAAEGGWRIVIVDGAETMNRNAANGLLKVLEEPPKLAILFLTADAPGRLLPTIRSRCRKLPLAALNAAAMDAATRHLLPDLDESSRAALIAISDGAPGRAVALAEEGALALAGLVREVLDAPNLSVARMYEVADKATRGDTAFGTFMGFLQGGVADAARGAARAGAGVVRARPLAQWGEVWHALGRLHDETERFSLDKRTAVVAGLQMLTKSP